MATAESFEDLKVWQTARQLNSEIYAELISVKSCNDQALKNQINRSAGSIMDNIAEGFERQGNKEFKQFLAISRGSCGEVKSQLYRAFDRGFISEIIFESLYETATNISKMLNSFIKYLRNSEIKGSKYLNEPNEDYPKNLKLST